MNIPPEIWGQILRYSHKEPFYKILADGGGGRRFEVHLDKQFSFDIPIFFDRPTESWYTGINPAQVANALDECVKKVQRKEDFVFSWSGEFRPTFWTKQTINLLWSPEKDKATYSVRTERTKIRYVMCREQFLLLLSVLKEIALQDSGIDAPWKTKGDDHIEPYLRWFEPYVDHDAWIYITPNAIISPLHFRGSIPTQCVCALDECVKKVKCGENFTFSFLGYKGLTNFDITFAQDGHVVVVFNVGTDIEKHYTISRFRFLLSAPLLREILLSRKSPSPRWNQEGDDYIEPYFTVIYDF